MGALKAGVDYSSLLIPCYTHALALEVLEGDLPLTQYYIAAWVGLG